MSDRSRRRRRTRSAAPVGALLLLALAGPVVAHQITGTRVATVARLTVDDRGIGGTYEVQYGELAALDERRRMDADGDGAIAAGELQAYVAGRAAALAAGLQLEVDGAPMAMAVERSGVAPDERAVVPGQMTLLLQLRAPDLGFASRQRQLRLRDGNQLPRCVHATIAWQAGDLVELRAPRASGEGALTWVEVQAPGGEAESAVALVPRAAAWRTAGGDSAAIAEQAPGAGWEGQLKAALRAERLSGRIVAVALLLAVFLGAAHALEPGHGKTLVAAYLVGERGTVGNAVFLGLVVTFTHTVSVILLGLVVLFASQYVLPEQIFPWLSTASGLLIAGLGVWLYTRHLSQAAGHRVPDRAHEHAHEGEHDHEHDHPHDHDDPEHAHGDAHGHGAHDPERARAPAHEHDHPHGRDHAHGGHAHHHVPQGRVTLGSLLALGITGGIVPCPGALVILLLAVGLGRIAFGLVLLAAFSVGLAAVLVVIGLLVVKARPLVEGFGGEGRWLRRLPVLSAAMITVVGLAMAVRGLMEAGIVAIRL